MKIHYLVLIAGLLAAGNTQGAVRLLTGDANNNIHSRDAFILDISNDGKRALFVSGPPAVGSTPGITQGGLYIRNVADNLLAFTGATNVGVEGTISDTGRYIAWTSPQNLIYWRDIQSGVTRLITPNANGTCRNPVMSADGRYVAYASLARNLVNTPGLLPAANRAGVYLYDSVLQTTRIVSLAHNGTALSTGIGAPSGNPAVEFDFSANGRYVVFSSDASNTHPSRSSASSQALVWLYRRDVVNGTVDVVSKSAANATPYGNYTTPRVDAVGNRIVFTGGFVGLIGGSLVSSGYVNWFGFDIYMKDMSQGTVWWVSKTTNNSTSDAAYLTTGINSNGTIVAFASSGTKFVAENTDPGSNSDSFDIFQANIGAAGAVTTRLVTKAIYGAGNVGMHTGPFVPGSGSYIAFNTRYLKSMLNVSTDNSIFIHGVGVGTFPAGNTNRYFVARLVNPGIAGQITLSPAQPVGGYIPNTVVTATATPNGTNIFASWYGAASSVSNRVTIVMNGNKTLGALFNNPGKIVLQDTANRTTLWFMQRTNVIAQTPLQNGATSPWKVLTAADFTADGQSDMVSQHTDGRVSIMTMNRNVMVSNIVLRGGAPLASVWKPVGAGDFNNDTKNDILWYNQTNRVLWVWYMNRVNHAGTAELNNSVGVNVGWRPVGVSDFDNDTKADVLFQQTSTAKLVLWLMNGTLLKKNFLVRNGTALPTGWNAVGIGDFTGEGSEDILLMKPTRQLAAWQMAGTNYQATIAVNGTTPVATNLTIRAVK
jgi:hypothetical protein